MVKKMAALAILLALAGCVGGERQVEIRSDVPVGVFEGPKALGSGAPARLTLVADGPHVLTVKAEGRRDAVVTFNPTTSGGRVALYVASCVLFPPALIMLPQRIGSGAFNDFEPAEVQVRMEPAR